MNPYLLACIVFAFFLLRFYLMKFIATAAEKKSVDEKRRFYLSRSIDLLLVILAIVLLLTYSGLDFDDLGLFLGSIVAVLGVALFAQWSILSNVTASLLIFFFFPYRVGDSIRILDGDNSIAGTIKEIALFHIIICDEQNQISTFPTSLIFQKAVAINPANRPKEINSDNE